MPDFQDKTLVCRDCGKPFVWTAGEQAFFEEKGFTNPPTRCPEDRKRNKEQKRAGRVMTQITCKECGKIGEVPFQPKDPNDVLCSDCFYKQRGETGSSEKPADKEELAQNVSEPTANADKTVETDEE